MKSSLSLLARLLSTAMLAGFIAASAIAQSPPPPGELPEFMRGYLNVPADLPPPNTEPHVLEGTWLNMRFQLPDLVPIPPVNAAGQAFIDKDKAMVKSGFASGALSEICRQVGPMWELSGNFPFKVIQTKKVTLIFQEELHSTIRIHMNKPLPDKVPISYEGYSVGHWEGDTLVVKTRGMDPRTHYGVIVPFAVSDQGVLTWKMRKINDGRNLEIVFSVDDPVYYTRPWTAEPIINDWRPELANFGEYDCEETTGTAEEAAKYGVKMEHGS